MAQNKHQEHPEDLLLTGELWVIDAFFGESQLSLKIDGCPAVIWGTHPENGRFFVGTKSVLNKRKIKICYTHEDVDSLYSHQESVAEILHACLDHLPHTGKIYQGDFIGFGGGRIYTPNTLTYVFPEIVTEKIIVAPHTQYEGETLPTAVAKPLQEPLQATSQCKLVQPFVDRVPLTPVVFDTDSLTFLDKKEADQAKVAINALIKSGQEVDIPTLTDIIGDEKLATLYHSVMNLKNQFLSSVIVYDSPRCFLNGSKIIGEGLVLHSDKGSFKIVDRYQFSYANFNSGKFR